MYTLAVCAEMVYRDLPIQERARRIHELGFQVEIWDWTRHDLAALARTGAVFSSMTGYIAGRLTDEDGAAELLRTAAESVRAAARLGCPRLNLHGTGLDEAALPVRPGAEPVEVFALADALIRPDFKARGLLDTAIVTIRFDNGALATAEASFQAVYGYDVRGEVLPLPATWSWDPHPCPCPASPRRLAGFTRRPHPSRQPRQPRPPRQHSPDPRWSPPQTAAMPHRCR